MRRLSALVAALWLVIMAADPAHAGGWATVTVDGWPEQWVAGESYALGVVIRGHGVMPITSQEIVRIEARHLSRDEQVTAEAVATDKSGYYQAELTLPSAGDWQITLGAGGYEETVVTTQAVEPGVAGQGAVRWWMALPIMALVAGVMATRRRVGWRLLAAGGAALVVLVSVLILSVESGHATDADKVRYGQELFLVKGCARCHIHAQAQLDWSTQMGPELTLYEPDETWVRRWLADPSSVRPNTMMPNLELAPHEIEALIAFLRAE